MPREDTALPRESCGQAQHPDPHREGEMTGRKHTEATPEGHGHNRRRLQTLLGCSERKVPDLLEQQLCRKNQGQHPMARGDGNTCHLSSQDPAGDKLG